MPHISKRKLKRGTEERLTRELSKFLSASGEKALQNNLSEFLTRTERIMLGKRLLALILFSRGLSQYRIAQLLGLSPSTLTRLARKIERGDLFHTLQKLQKYSTSKKLEGLVKDMLSMLVLPLLARKYSLRRFI